MKIYKKESVFEAGLNRIRYIFDEFEEVVVAFSGGKDSTAVLNMALIVAREKGRLPLKLMFLDQEAEWQLVVDYIREVMLSEEIEPLWYQVPFKIENATSKYQNYLKVWEEGKEWMRPKEDISIKELKSHKDGEIDFYSMFKIITNEIPAKNLACLGGVRCEESPTRLVALTHWPKYKHVTWGKTLDEKTDRYTFYPLYDWSHTDIWKAIHDNGWKYSKIYDYQYRHGIPTREMRVSNLHHETAFKSLFYLQEFEPKTYEALCKRLDGIHAAGKMTTDYFVSELPFMFRDWKEYRDFLLDKLIDDESWKKEFIKNFKTMELYEKDYGDEVHQIQVLSILSNDHLGVKMKNWKNTPERVVYRKKLKGVDLW